MSKQTVEQLQAEIASQAAQIDELKNRLSVLDEFRVASQNKLIAAHEQHCERFRAVGMKAYAEGFDDAWASNFGGGCIDSERDECWERSDARAALQPKEGER